MDKKIVAIIYTSQLPRELLEKAHLEIQAKKEQAKKRRNGLKPTTNKEMGA